MPRRPRGRQTRQASSPVRRATSAGAARPPPTSPTRTCSPSIRSSTATRSRTARSPRLWTGALWAEGPAWNAQGRYLVWSDIPNNRQLRWLEDDGHVSVFRPPSNNSNGNTLRLPGPPAVVRAPHAARRALRARRLDDRPGRQLQGKRLNSPNDVVPHPDGSYWFTDPPYGGQLYEGAPDAAGGPSNASGRLEPAARPAAGDRRLRSGSCRPTATASIPSGRVDLVVTEEQVPDPNGLCFSPDYKKLYVASTGKGPGDTGPGGKGDMYVFDVGADNKLSNRKLFSDFMIDGVKCGPDGVRCDVDGNVWCSSNAGRARRLQRRHRVEPGRQADRPHPPAGDLRQRLLRRAQAQPAVHGGEPVPLCRLCEHAGGRAGISGWRLKGARLVSLQHGWRAAPAGAALPTQIHAGRDHRMDGLAVLVADLAAERDDAFVALAGAPLVGHRS